ncbi:MAG: Type 1 glutamine amidotransferase-like domain-containing protein [Patescibacteria group bacterium]
MKLLLTSTGITNKSIENKFLEMVGKPPQDLTVAYIPTAVNVAKPTDKRWIIKNLIELDQMKIGKIDIVEFSAIPKEIWLPRLKQADAIMVGGGNPYHLIYWMEKAGLTEILKDLIKEKVYVGCSAGSVILGKVIVSTAPKKYVEEIPEFEGDKGLEYVDFSIRPHFYNPNRPQYTDETVQVLADELKSTFYAIDDNSAVAVTDGRIEVISEGKWKKFEPLS